MLIRLITFFLFIAWPLSVLAGPGGYFKLSPQKGLHQFPFFSQPTPVWNYNGQVPGPIIRGKAGTTITVDVMNQLTEGTSVHWHGLRVDNAMDGVPGVTQDPILPGETFTYNLRLMEPGTYWYHPHLNAGEQLERGLKGALIVEEPEKQAWSQDLVWLIDDWRLQQDGTIYPHFNTHHDLMHDGRWGNAVTINGQWKPQFTAIPGERIRLRFINGANARVLRPVLNGLEAMVIAVDGRPVSAVFPYEPFFLSPGNRIDLDITIPVNAAGKMFEIQDIFTRRTISLATIHVKNMTAVKTPRFDIPTAENFLPATLFEKAAVVKTWDLNAVRGGPYGIGWLLNQRLWPEADKANLTIGKPQKIVFTNSSTRLHPMHIHGVFFRQLEKDGAPAIEPFTRDTVLVGPRQIVTIGLVPEHHGIWLTHCHIQSHADAGMMTSVIVE